MTDQGLYADALLTSQARIRVIDNDMPNGEHSLPERAEAEDGAHQRQWSVDDIIADPLGYQREVDALLAEDAVEWVDREMSRLAAERRREQYTFWQRVGTAVTRLMRRRPNSPA